MLRFLNIVCWIFCFISSIFARNNFPDFVFVSPVPQDILFKKILHPYPTLDSTRYLCQVDQVHGTRPSTLPRNATGKNILVGIIDTEFDTHHPAFLDKNGNTRFIALWNQGDTAKNVSNRFGYGVIKNHAQLQSDSLFGLVENHVHGTMTASIAAGSERSFNFYGMAPDAMIAAVMYSNDLDNISDGISWIFSLADSLEVPCVVNLSIGISYGPHDGTSLFDRFVDSVSGPGRIIVGAAGNDYNHNTHTQFKLAPNDSESTWLTPKLYKSGSDSIYVSGVDIWGEKSKTFSIQPIVIDTTSKSMSSFKNVILRRTDIEYEDSLIWKNNDGSTDKIQMFIKAEPSSNLNNKPHFMLYFQSSSHNLFGGVKVINGKDNCTIHAWHIYKQALQNLDMDRFHNGDPQCSVNEIGGTAKRIIVAGSYTGRVTLKYWNDSLEVTGDHSGDITHFSGTGPTVDGRIKPDITAPGWRIVVAMSRSSQPDLTPVIWPDISRKSGRYAEATGTSASAPVVTGIIALMLEIDASLTPETALQCIWKSAIHDQWTGDITTPINRWGAGKINAEGAVQEVIRLTSVKKIACPEIKSKISFSYSGNSVHIKNFNEKGTAVFFNLQGRQIAKVNFTESGIIAIPGNFASGLFTMTFYRQNGTSIGSYKIAVDH
ncbi:MAG TPA: S8 family serine peptidase [Chitinispirillaceae bacterium]|nr:S8 family serine peptidase [Chitinispirillaceae bacterium]